MTQTAAQKKAATLAYLEANFGLSSAIIAMDKTDPKKGFTLKEALNKILGPPRITDPNRVANLLAKTNWFQQNGVEVTKRLSQEKTAKGVFDRAVKSTYDALRDQMIARGMSVSDKDLQKVARDAYVYGLDQSTVMEKLVGSKSYDYTGGGSTGETMRQLKAYAYGNGVSFSSQDEELWATQILKGEKTTEDYANVLREKAAQKYTVFADQIREGQNLSDLTAAYREKMANLLEIGADQISWDDPLFKDGKAFTALDADGKPVAKPLWDFEKEIKQDSRWQYTNNARDSYTTAGLNLLKRFGMVS